MKLSTITMIALLGAAVAAPSFAQPGPPAGGPGTGMGKGPAYVFDQDNTAGWALITAEERAANQQKMYSFKTYDECKAYQGEHHKAMEARAKEKGKTLTPPRNNACDRMKAQGLLK
jgi:hypothetical protein